MEATGYGIVMPTIDELSLEQPEIVQQGGRYGVRLEASAPSIQMMKATIHTEISPIVGTEKQSEELVQSLLRDFESDPVKLWESNIFGKSLHELVNDGLQNKLLHMPPGSPHQNAGNVGAGHQRGLHRPHLHLTLNKNSPRREFRRGLQSF